MKRIITLFVIVALFGSCKKEENKAPTPVVTNTKLLVVELQSTEPQGAFFGYIVELNGVQVASPISVIEGDSIYVNVFNPLGNAYILKCYLDNSNVYPNANYQYSDVNWSYIIP